MDDKKDKPPSDTPFENAEETQESTDRSPDVIFINDDSEGDDYYDDDDDSTQNELCVINTDDDDGEIKWKSAEILQTLVSEGYRDPRLILNRLFEIDFECLPLSKGKLWRILSSLFAEISTRRPLKQYSTIQSVVSLLEERSKILVLTGAGISVSCGIPDFRSRDGVYARLERDFSDLRSPQDMFDLAFFKSNPNPFFTFANELFPGRFKPSFTHRFIRLLEKKSKLLRNYTQNIDTLEEIAGISKVIPCHGSFATASCLGCKFQVPGEAIREAIMSQHIPYCPKCCPEVGLKGMPATLVSNSGTQPLGESKPTPPVNAVMKPDIVFFGESLPSEFHSALEKDVRDVDLVLVMGSSLKVRPVSYIPNNIPRRVPQILINRELLSNHRFDVELLGDCDVIIEYLCTALGWDVDSDSDDDSTPEKTTGRSLTQVDLVVPLNAALESLANEPDANLSALGPEGDMSTFDPESPKGEESKGSSSAEPKRTTKTPKDLKEHIDKVGAKEEILEADGTSECPINVRDNDSDPDWEEEDFPSLQNRESVIKLSKYLPEDSYAYIPKRLYVFRGSELAISTRIAAEYVAAHSQPDGSNGVEGSLSPASSVGDDDESFIECVLRRCRHDPELEKERRKCIEENNEDEDDRLALEEGNQEAIEVINVDDFSRDSIHEDLTSSASPNDLDDNGRHARTATPCELINGTSPKTKRRRCSLNGRTAEEDSESANVIYGSASSLNGEKAVNA